MRANANCTGVIYQQARNKTIINLELEGNCAEFFYKVKDRVLSITAAIYSERRSSQANRYYWQIVGEIAKHLGVSNSRVHNIMLRRYGTLEDFDGNLGYASLCIDDDELLDNDVLHLKPTSEIRPDRKGNFWRTYTIIKGSSKYNKEEMSKLVNGAVDEAKEMGIETETPEELERMMKLYEEHHS